MTEAQDVTELIDPKPTASSAPSWRGAARQTPPQAGADATAFDFVELFFFAYRDFVGDADRLLEKYAFGRAHHRVLHFVARRPGLPVAALLDILKITKQSLNRVLKPLLDAGFIEARAGAADRRQRLLHPTRAGAELASELAALQTARIARALAGLRPEDHAAAAEFLLAMIDAKERERVRARVAWPPGPGDAAS